MNEEKPRNQGALVERKQESYDRYLPSLEVYEPVPGIDDAMGLRDVLDVIIRRKWIIILALSVVFITTLLVSLSMTPIFKAEGSLQIEPAPVKVTKFEDIVESQLRVSEAMKTNVELLKSPTLAMRVIQKLNLQSNPMFNPLVDESGKSSQGENGKAKGLSGLWRGFFRVFGRFGMAPELARLKEENFLKNKFLGNLEVKTERDTTVIRVAFTDPDPFLASTIVNALLEEFVDWQMDQKIQSAAMARSQLEKQIEQARIKLEKAEENLNRFSKEAGIVSLDSKMNLIYRQLEEINSALAEAHARRVELEARYEQAKSGNIESLPEVINNQLIQQLRQELVRVTSEYEKLIPVYKPEYPRLKILRAQMDEIQAKINGEIRRIYAGIENEYLRALEQERRLEKAAQEKKQEAIVLNEKATQYKILEREVETNKQIYQSLLERAREIEANVGAEISNIQIVDRATPPIEPYRPNIRLNLLLALVLGLGLGVGSAFLLEYLDNTVKSVDEITDRFRLPILGTLPMVEEEEELSKLDTLLVQKPKAAFAEALRTARTSVELSAPLDHPPKAILVTSSTVGEGKSTFSSNLALAYATAGKRVLLIDADMRKPHLHHVFGNNSVPDKGLSNYLSGGCSFDSILHKTQYERLYFVPAGPIPPNPAELLASMKMKKTIEKLKDVFDCVIFDAPPAAGFADVLVLANAVDGVILVSALGETHREALRIFKRNMYNIKANVLGCVVNKIPFNMRYGKYSYYKYYRYSYYYQPYYHYEKQLVDEGEKSKGAEG